MKSYHQGEVERLSQTARAKVLESNGANKVAAHTVTQLYATGSPQIRAYLKNAQNIVTRYRRREVLKRREAIKIMARSRLIAVVQKHIRPLLSKADTIQSRLGFAKLIRTYMSDMNPCLTAENGKLSLSNTKGTTVVTFDKRIGTESSYGVAYMAAGKGFHRLLKFACKIMDDRKDHVREVKLLKHMNMFTELHVCPNFPLTYNVLKCEKPCNYVNNCLRNRNRDSSGYYVVMNELADCDLRTFFKSSIIHNSATYESLAMQMFFAIYAFHRLRYSHEDAHHGNFLVHKIAPGGCWWYKIEDIDVYVPNTGYLLVLWDPGTAIKMKHTTFKVDYERCFNIFNKDCPPFDTKEALIKCIRSYLAGAVGEIQFATRFLSTVPLRSVRIGVNTNGSSNRRLINTRPYLIYSIK